MSSDGLRVACKPGSDINRMLWMLRWLLYLRTERTSLRKVIGHKGFKGNEMADQLASLGVRLSEETYVCQDTSIRWRLEFARWWEYALLRSNPEEDALGATKGLQPLDGNLSATRVVALDCEMVGVGPGGLQSILARVCIINSSGNVLYDTFVKNTEPITDYRTAFSGVRAADLKAGSACIFMPKVTSPIRSEATGDLRLICVWQGAERSRTAQRFLRLVRHSPCNCVGALRSRSSTVSSPV